MRRIIVWLGAGVLGITVAGCASVDFPGQPSVGELARDLAPDELVRSEYVRPAQSAATVRLQRGDDAPIMLAQAPPVAAPIAAPPPLPGPLSAQIAAPIAPPPTGAAPKKSPPTPEPTPTVRPIDIAPPPSSGLQPVNMRANRSSRVQVRAWVNGRPIFHDEVMLELEMTVGGIGGAPPEVINKAYSETLSRIIDLEIAYQDAVKKLEKVGGKTLERLKEQVEREYEKQARNIQKNVPAEKFQEIAPTFRRQFERQFIGMEYARSMVSQKTDQIGYLQIKDYYDTHLNEFQKVESVKWQHVFLAVNKDRPTVADCRAQGESLIARVNAASPEKQENAFKELSEFDDGDSKTRGAMGFGNRKGEVQPAQLEKELFELTNGQIGGIYEVPGTGVHLFRLIERDPGGQVALNDTVQSQIRNKIRNQVFEREFKSFIRQLKARAIWEVEK